MELKAKTEIENESDNDKNPNIECDAAGGGGGGGHSVLASAMEPATLAHTYITDKGAFKPAPQPPRKTPTAPKNPKLPDFAHLAEDEAEAQLLQSLTGHGCSTMAGDQSDRQTSSGALSDQEVGVVMQQWFKEQKRFQQNVALRRQHVQVSRQIAQLHQHLAATATEAMAKTKRKKPEGIKEKKRRRKQLASS